MIAHEKKPITATNTATSDNNPLLFSEPYNFSL